MDSKIDMKEQRDNSDKTRTHQSIKYCLRKDDWQ
jgi:hypothetical protein